MILIDTGPLVALFDKDDRYHALCKKELSRIRAPLVTTWPVLTKVMYLLNFSAAAQDLCLEFIESGRFLLDAAEIKRIARIRQLITQYQDLPMDFADASLVAFSEEARISEIFTLDRKDFLVYRPMHLTSFRLLPERL